MKFEVKHRYLFAYVLQWLNITQDPLIRKRILQLLVTFSTRALDSKPAIMLRVLEHILMTWPALQPEHRLFNDAIRDLQTESMVELQRLASKMPDPLLVSITPSLGVT
jgi:exportin-5